MNRILGNVISGSLIDGFLIRIHPTINPEEIKTGKFVSICSEYHKFFSLITDLKLEVSNPDILLFPPTLNEKKLLTALRKRDIYATAHVRPMVMLDNYNKVLPVKTIPPHFSPVCEVNNKDVALIFGDENEPDKRYFNIGHPIDMETPVCLDLDKLVERSNGIFGKTGTGKTFLTRLVLAGTIKNEKAVNLVFDMHGEYGLQARKEGKNESFVKGLKTLFPDKIVIFSLDPESTRRRGGMPDVEVELNYNDINVEDILSLQGELNLNPTALESAYLIASKYKKNWLEALLTKGENPKDFAQELGANTESIAALYRKLKRIERLKFFTPELINKRCSVIDRMMEYISSGKHIIVEFGNYTSTFVYLLIANIITRRIHAEYVSKTEIFLGSHKKEDEPKKLLITIEEAHKFLNTAAAQQTIFGTIAREMRKYYVSLLVVDQRPSGIDPEILSQIGTKIIAQLNDERDIQAVLTGTSANTFKSILASLDSKKQVLLLGHAVAMPVVVETREYNEDFYKAMNDFIVRKTSQEIINEIF